MSNFDRTYRWNSDDVLTLDEEVTLIHVIEVGTLAAAARDGLLRTDATAEELALLVAEGQRARERYLTGNLGLVFYFANRAASRHGGTVDDLVQEGFLGLVRALDRFDPGAGVRFSTYAASWVRAAIEEAMIREMGLTRQVSRRLRRVQRIQRDLEQQHGRVVGPDEVAARLGGSTTEVEETMGRAEPLSLDAFQAEVADQRDRDAELRVWVGEQVADLPRDQRRVVRRRYGFDGRPPASRPDCADELGISKRRLRVLEDAALATLRRWHEAA